MTNVNMDDDDEPGSDQDNDEDIILNNLGASTSLVLDNGTPQQ
jgi:hypothetical protein